MIGAMLVAGLFTVGLAGILVSNDEGSADEDPLATAGGQDATGATTTLRPDAADQADDETAGPDGSDQGDDFTDPGEGTLDDRQYEVVTAAFGDTVTVLDGVEVTAQVPRTFQPSPSASTPEGARGFLAFEVMVVNQSDATHRLDRPIHVADTSVVPGSDPARPGGYEPVEDPEGGLTTAWEGPLLEPGGTAYGLFGIALPGNAPNELYGIVLIDSDVDQPVAVVFAGTRP